MANPTVNVNTQPVKLDLGVFTRISKSGSDQIVITNAKGQVSLGGKVGYSNWKNRTPVEKANNNRTRTALLESLCNMYDIDFKDKSQLEQNLKTRLPKAVLDVLNLSKFGLSKGKVTSGRPLSERRITLISDAIVKDIQKRSSTYVDPRTSGCGASDIVQARYVGVTEDIVKKWDSDFLSFKLQKQLGVSFSSDGWENFGTSFNARCETICDPNTKAIDRDREINAINDLVSAKLASLIKEGNADNDLTGNFKKFKLGFDFVLECMGPIREEYDKDVAKRAEALNEAAVQLGVKKEGEKLFDFKDIRGGTDPTTGKKRTFNDIDRLLAVEAYKLGDLISKKIKTAVDSIEKFIEAFARGKGDETYYKEGAGILRSMIDKIDGVNADDEDDRGARNLGEELANLEDRLVPTRLGSVVHTVFEYNDDELSELRTKHPEAQQELRDFQEGLSLALAFKDALLAKFECLDRGFMDRLSTCIARLANEPFVPDELPSYIGNPTAQPYEADAAYITVLRDNPLLVPNEKLRDCMKSTSTGNIVEILQNIFNAREDGADHGGRFVTRLAYRLKLGDGKCNALKDALLRCLSQCKENDGLLVLCEKLVTECPDLKPSSDDKKDDRKNELASAITASILQLVVGSIESSNVQDSLICDNGGGLVMVNERQFIEGEETFSSTFTPRQQVEHENGASVTMSHGLTNLARTTLEVVRQSGDNVKPAKTPVLTMLRFGCVGTKVNEKGGSDYTKDHYRQLAEQVFLASEKLKKEAKENGNRITVPIFRTDVTDNNDLDESKVKLGPFTLKFKDGDAEVAVEITPKVIHFYAPTDSRLPTIKPSGPKTNTKDKALFTAATMKSNTEIITDLCAKAEEFKTSVKDDKTRVAITLLTEQIKAFQGTLERCMEDDGTVIARKLYEATKLEYGPLMQRFGARVTVLAAMIGYVPAINCNWSRDRTGTMDSECKMLAIQIHQAKEGELGSEIPSIDAELTQREIELRNRMLEKTGNADLARQINVTGSPISLNQCPDSGFHKLFRIGPNPKSVKKQGA